ncbi:NAD(P)-binding protein [Whalleya microplaca]|nr:NAD(P)-binding protein [Whalleya microplaca]
MAAAFDVSPEKEGSILNYFYRQLTQTPAEVCGVDLSGKTAIVTGSNVGVGLECSRQLLDLGLTKLVLAVRNLSKGQVAATELCRDRNLNKDTIEVWELDYASYDSVCFFVERTKGLERLDIVILNAGTPLQPGRITITSSDTAAWAKLDEINANPLLPSFDKPGNIDMANRMFVSKLLGQLFMVELAKRVPSSVAVINAATPMMVHDSELSRETARTISGKVVEAFRRRIGYTAAVGARMIVDAAVKHGEETHGQYLGLQKLKPMAPIVTRGRAPTASSMAGNAWGIFVCRG